MVERQILSKNIETCRQDSPFTKRQQSLNKEEFPLNALMF